MSAVIIHTHIWPLLTKLWFTPMTSISPIKAKWGVFPGISSGWRLSGLQEVSLEV